MAQPTINKHYLKKKIIYLFIYYYKNKQALLDWRECFIFETTIGWGRPHSMSNIWWDWNEESSINTLQIDIAQMRPLNIKYRTSVDLFFGWLTNWPNGDHWQNGNSNFFSFLFYKQIKVIRFSCYWLLFFSVYPLHMYMFYMCVCLKARWGRLIW